MSATRTLPSGLTLVPAFALALAGGCKKSTNDAEKPAGLPASATASAPAPSPTPPPAPPAAPPAAEEAPAAPDPATSVGGSITLPAARKKNVGPNDTIFIVARKAGGPPGPGSMLAAQKHPVGDFPMPFLLSGRDAMIPGTPFEGMVDITVRIDKDGDAMTRKKGDLFGEAKNVKVGTQNVTIPVDSVMAEDQVLGGGMARPGAGMPPGHP